jgi:hypothetical protein
MRKFSPLSLEVLDALIAELKVIRERKVSSDREEAKWQRRIDVIMTGTPRKAAKMIRKIVKEGRLDQ